MKTHVVAIDNLVMILQATVRRVKKGRIIHVGQDFRSPLWWFANRSSV